MPEHVSNPVCVALLQFVIARCYACKHTKRELAHEVVSIARGQLGIHTTIEDVRIKEGLSYDRVLGVLERRIEPSVNWSRFSHLGTLGLDEIASKKGQGHYLVIVTARQADGRVRILGVLPNREKDTVLEFLRSIP